MICLPFTFKFTELTNIFNQFLIINLCYNLISDDVTGFKNSLTCQLWIYLKNKK